MVSVCSGLWTLLHECDLQLLLMTPSPSDGTARKIQVVVELGWCQISRLSLLFKTFFRQALL